jgi:phosphinothricin acetyltransferase
MPAPGAGARIKAMTGAHAAAVLAIYQAGIEEGNATFETRAPGWPEFTAARLPGHRLLDALIASTEAAGIWTIESGVFPENTASLGLHQAAGFRVVGIRERLRQHHGRWRDVLLIECRSPVR